jgi:hypothetical protein
MPKHDKKRKVKGNEVGAKTADEFTDDDFDNMLAELQASDLTNITTTITTTATSAGSNRQRSSRSSTGSSSSDSSLGEEVTEAMIMQASVRGDVNRLRRWAKRGVRVSTTRALSEAIMKNDIFTVRCLVKELGADVNGATE